MGQEFYFGSELRWQMGFATPNYLGTFIAMVLPALWAIGSTCRQTRLWFAVFLVELVLWYALGRTFSRGGVIAALLAAALYILMSWRFIESRPHGGSRLLFVVSIFRAAIPILVLYVSGVMGRLDPSYSLADAAVTNRLELWKGGLKMIAASPLRGWGWGESGSQFMNWYQDIHHTGNYSGLVSSHLQIAVELGAFAALAWWLIPTGAILTAVQCLRVSQKPMRGAGVVIAACASIVAFVVGNAFSTLGEEPLLWIVYISAVFVILLVMVRTGKLCVLRWSLPLSGAICGILILTTVALAYGLCRQDELIIKRAADGTMLLTARDAQVGPAKKLGIVFDERVCGAKFGRILREERVRWLFGNREVRVAEFGMGFRIENVRDAAIVILTGRAASTVAEMHPKARCYIVDPMPTREGYAGCGNGAVFLSRRHLLDTEQLGLLMNTGHSFTDLNVFMDSADGWNQLMQRVLGVSENHKS